MKNNRLLVLCLVLVISSLFLANSIGLHRGIEIGRAEVTEELAPAIAANEMAVAALGERLERLTEAVTFYGQASYYKHGTVTASREPFDKNALTAASRWLPFGSFWRVTNEKNGRAVVIRINDRGPYIDGRIIDLSEGAARRIGMIEAGVTPVKIEPVVGIMEER